MYIGEDSPEESDFQYIPDTKQLNTKLPAGSDPLTGSMILLKQALQSGVGLTEFEVRNGIGSDAARNNYKQCFS